MNESLESLHNAFRKGFQVGLQLGDTPDSQRSIYRARKKVRKKLSQRHLEAWLYGFQRGVVLRELRSI